jgi:hypothetical protein
LADQCIEKGPGSAEISRAAWQAPQVTRFAAAGAEAGNTTSSGDGETSKS